MSCYADSSEHQHRAVSDLLWPFLWNSIFLKMTNSLICVGFFLFLVVLVTDESLYNCRLLLSYSLVCAQWKQSGPACCLNVVFLLFSFCVVHFYPRTWSSCHIVFQTLLVEVNNLATIVLRCYVTTEVWLLNWSICGEDCFSSRKRSGERNFEGSIL